VVVVFHALWYVWRKGEDLFFMALWYKMFMKFN